MDYTAERYVLAIENPTSGVIALMQQDGSRCLNLGHFSGQPLMFKNRDTAQAICEELRETGYRGNGFGSRGLRVMVMHMSVVEP